MVTFVLAPRGAVCLLLAVILLACSPGLAGAAPHASSGPAALMQLLPPGQNPDDDGDGVDDRDDPAPNDPGTGSVPPPAIDSSDQDSDGDGIPNVQDPDDDNAGVSDRDDPAPFDPGIEPTPVPDNLSPIHDDDGDGIPNIQDPDDDNGGMSDDADPGEPDMAPGADGQGSSGARSTAPVVTKLPVTGAGDAAMISPVAGALAVLATVLGIVALAGAVSRQGRSG